MIARDEIHVRLISTALDDDALARAREVLSDDERQRAESFRFPADRVRSIVARSTLRQILGRELGRDPRELRFVTGEHGKPALAEGELEFNVSHSGERVAIAIATSPVGIDIERERDMRDRNAIARRFFAPAEAAAVERDGDQFFPIWTAKESVIKAIGTGLAIDLRSFEAFAPQGAFRPVTNLSGWFVRALAADDGYHAALTTRAAQCAVVVSIGASPR